MEYHPIANLLPLHPLPGLRDSLKRHGLIEAIITLDGMILDGRQRYEACQEANVEPRYQEYNDECGDPVSFVKARNLDRRQLTPVEKAMAAAKLMDYWRNEQNKPKGRARDKAAKEFGASPASTARMDKVLTQGVPELVEAVTGGDLGLEEASDLASLSPQEQLERLVSPDTKADEKYAADERPGFLKSIKRLLNRAKDVTRDFSSKNEKKKSQFYDLMDQSFAHAETI